MLISAVASFMAVWKVSAKSLADCVACVTGATRGIGRGIALGLAEQGATVYVTGRSINPDVLTEKNLGGTLLDLVDEMNSLGGRGIAVKVDHKQDQEVKNLFEQIERDSGKLNILVNNAFQVPSVNEDGEDIDSYEYLFRDFWEQPGWFWDQVIDVGLRSHYVASCYATPLLIKTKKMEQKRAPLIVQISSFGGITYSFNVAYGVGKAGVDRLTRDMQVELDPHGVQCVSLYPGIVRTERMKDILDSGDWEKRSELATPQIFVESPMLSGKVIAALYSSEDGYQEKQKGKVCVTAEIAKRYNIIDPHSGIIPPSIRSLKFLIPSVLLANIDKDKRPAIQEQIISWSPDILLPMFVMAEPRPKSQK